MLRPQVVWFCYGSIYLLSQPPIPSSKQIKSEFASHFFTQQTYSFWEISASHAPVCLTYEHALNDNVIRYAETAKAVFNIWCPSETIRLKWPYLD